MASVALSKINEQFIAEQLASGRYRDASEVVDAGLRMLELETSREQWLKSEIPQRLSEMRENLSIGIPAEQVFAELEPRVRATKAR